MSFEDVCLIRNLFFSFLPLRKYILFWASWKRFWPFLSWFLIGKLTRVLIVFNAMPHCFPFSRLRGLACKVSSIFTESCNASLTFSGDRLDRKELRQSDIIVLWLWAQLLIPLFDNWKLPTGTTCSSLETTS